MKKLIVIALFLCGSAAFGQAKTIPEKVDCKWSSGATFVDYVKGCECPKKYEPRKTVTSPPCSTDAIGCDAVAIIEFACHLKSSAKHVVQKNVPLCVDVLNDGELSVPYVCDKGPKEQPKQ